MPFPAEILPTFLARLLAGAVRHNVAAMDIVSDTKDWTWVLERPCPDCGFDAAAVSGRDVAAMLRVAAQAWQVRLRREDVRDRPNAVTWSPLEYASHVRDVCLRFDARLALMLTQVQPEFENWDQDATAVEERYGEQDPSGVATELAASAETLAAHFDQARGDQWQRTGQRSDGARFTVDSFARYFLHDVLHHLHDVGIEVRPTHERV